MYVGRLLCVPSLLAALSCFAFTLLKDLPWPYTAELHATCCSMAAGIDVGSSPLLLLLLCLLGGRKKAEPGLADSI